MCNSRGVHIVIQTATLYFLKFVWLNLQMVHFITAGFAQNFTKQTCIRLKQKLKSMSFLAMSGMMIFPTTESVLMFSYVAP